MMNHSGSGGGSSINTSCFDLRHHTNAQGFEDLYEGFEELFSSSSTLNNPSSLLYNLSVILKEKVQELQSIVAMTVTSPPHHSTAAFSSAGSLIHEIIGAASSMLALLSPVVTPGNELDHQQIFQSNNSSSGAVTAAVNTAGSNERRMSTMINMHRSTTTTTTTRTTKATAKTDDHVIELDAAGLLAKYSHFCHVCGKGFKRDANLRMHMRSHGDEYKTNAALANPTKKNKNRIHDVTTAAASNGQKQCYSCPEIGCRWNKNHAKFQPLKSMVCAKNHYKRSHCPKMFVCNRCGHKNFSVLSDLRTHEKHCGDDHRWRCSCGTAFSRKDKLMGHVKLFAGHAPAAPLDKYCSSTSQALLLQGN